MQNKRINQIIQVGLLLLCGCNNTVNKDIDKPQQVITNTMIHSVGVISPTITPIATDQLTSGQLITPTSIDTLRDHIQIPFRDSEWKYYALENNKFFPNHPSSVKSIAITQDNNVWLATDLGLWEISDGETYNYNAVDLFLSKKKNNETTILDFLVGENKKYYIGKDLFAYEQIKKVVADETGVLWLVHKGPFSSFITYGNPTTGWKNIDLQIPIIDISVVSPKAIWILQKQPEEAMRLSLYTIKNMKILQNITLSNIHAKSILSTNNQQLIINSEEGLFYLYGNKLVEDTSLYSDLNIDHKYFNGFVNLSCSFDNSLWGNYGYELLHKKMDGWEKYDMYYIQGTDIVSVDQAKDLTIWAGDGYLDLSDSKFYSFSKPPFYQVNVIRVDPLDNIWYGTDSGVYLYERKR
jgi:ligand-binding sensor domain-containing protein